jgi:predicted ferric reductase
MEQVNQHLAGIPANPAEPKKTESPIWAGLGAIVVGILLSALVIPGLVPGLLFSVSGTEPKFFWYISRATAIISFIFLWISLVLGLLLSGKIARYFPGAFTANDLHQFISITGLVTGLFHGLLLMGDKYIHLSLLQVILPFASQSYRPEWVGIGQLCFYVWAFLILSFYVRKYIGFKTWRSIHFIGYLVFTGVMVHGITSGTDSGTVWMTALYLMSGASVLFLTFYRIFAHAGIQPQKVVAR